MEYLRARSDKKFVHEFSQKLSAFHDIEEIAKNKLGQNRMGYGSPANYQDAIRQRATAIDPKYAGLRDYLSRHMERLKAIAVKHSIAADFYSRPPAAVGGPIIPQNIFDAILLDTSYSLTRYQDIHDKLQAVIGACEDHERAELFDLINPLYLSKKLLFLILRIPFILIEATGFNVSKIEDTLFGHVTKAILLLLIMWVLLNWFDFTKDDVIRLFSAS